MAASWALAKTYAIMNGSIVVFYRSSSSDQCRFEAPQKEIVLCCVSFDIG